MNANGIFWAEPVSASGPKAGGYIGHAQRPGTHVNQHLISVPTAPTGVAVDPEHVHWTDDGSGPTAIDWIGRASAAEHSVNQQFIRAGTGVKGTGVTR